LDRGAGAPDQAVLVDMPGRRLYFLGLEIWPQEIYLLTGLLIIAAFTLFLASSLVGRIWCGYACPQSLWTDLFMLVERRSRATGWRASASTPGRSTPTRRCGKSPSTPPGC
jgi:polyferredoxin